VWEKSSRADFVCPSGVFLNDFAWFVAQWLKEDCQAPGWCEQADLNHNGDVNMTDFALFANFWLDGV
jgi:hypothetical protein